MGNLVSGRKLSVMALFLVLLALAAFMAVSLFSSTAQAGQGELNKFTGFWMAVDPSDGGFNKLSITDIGGGVAKLGLSETFVSSCGGGRATLSGLGEINQDGNLVVPITIQCKTGDEATVGPFPVTFVVLSKNLIEFQFSVLRVPYHKVSSD